MEIFVSVVNSNNVTVSRNKLSTSDSAEMLMQILAVHSGSNNITNVCKVYVELDLYGKSAEEVVNILTDQYDSGDEGFFIERLNLEAVTDDVSGYLQRVLNFINTSSVGDDMAEETEGQSITFVKIS